MKFLTLTACDEPRFLRVIFPAYCSVIEQIANHAETIFSMIALRRQFGKSLFGNCLAKKISLLQLIQ